MTRARAIPLLLALLVAVAVRPAFAEADDRPLMKLPQDIEYSGPPDQLQNLGQHWFVGLPGILEEMMGGEMLAHHVARQQLGAIGIAEVLVTSPNRDYFVVLDRPVADAVQVCVEHMEVLVRFVELDAEDCGGVDIVPEET